MSTTIEDEVEFIDQDNEEIINSESEINEDEDITEDSEDELEDEDITEDSNTELEESSEYMSVLKSAVEAGGILGMLASKFIDYNNNMRETPSTGLQYDILINALTSLNSDSVGGAKEILEVIVSAFVEYSDQTLSLEHSMVLQDQWRQSGAELTRFNTFMYFFNAMAKYVKGDINALDAISLDEVGNVLKLNDNAIVVITQLID